MSSVYFQICFNIQHHFYVIPAFLPHTAVLPLPGPSQGECAAAIMMASVWHVKTAGKKGNCCSCTLHSWTGFPVASRIRSSPSTMTAAGSVACGGEISDGLSVMRGKEACVQSQSVVFDYWEEQFIILFEICSDCGGQPIVYCLITVKAQILHNTGDRMIASQVFFFLNTTKHKCASGIYDLHCVQHPLSLARPDNENFPKKL